MSWRRQKRISKKELSPIERLVPWGERISIIKPHYYEGERGNQPFALELMLRLHLLQNLYDLSDMGMMERFRNILVRNGL